MPRHESTPFLTPPEQPTIEDVIVERDALAKLNLELLREIRALSRPARIVTLQRRLSSLLGAQVRHVDAAPMRFRREDH